MQLNFKECDFVRHILNNQRAEAAEAFWKWRGIGQKGHFWVYDQNPTILCRSWAEWKYGVFITSVIVSAAQAILAHFSNITL
jgi:hypothetical protein